MQPKKRPTVRETERALIRIGYSRRNAKRIIVSGLGALPPAADPPDGDPPPQPAGFFAKLRALLARLAGRSA